MDVRDYLTHETYFDEFIILSGDADFTPVLQRLRQHARRTVIYCNEYTAQPYTAICDGEVREADLCARRALQTDAYLANAGEILIELFRSALHLGDNETARAWCARGKRTTSGDLRFIECDLTLMLYDKKAANPEQAWAIADSMWKLDPPERARAAGWPYRPYHRLMMAATVSARSGHVARARAEWTRARDETAGDSVLRTDLLLDESVLLYALGARDSAASRLENYIRLRGYRQFLSINPLYAPIIGRPRTSGTAVR